MSIRLIGLTGTAGCGKSTAGHFLRFRRGYTEAAFSWLLKDLIGKCLFDFSDDQLYGPSHMRNAGDPRYTRPDGTMLTPREVLQVMGTDAARKLWPTIWVDACMRTVDNALAGGNTVVITDMRFDNEAEAVIARGGIVIKLCRTEGGLEGAAAAHSSEAGVSPHLIAEQIHNTGTKDALYAMLDAALARHG